MVNIKIGIDCSLDDVDITAELRVIGGLVYSTVTFQSHPRCNFFSNCECSVAKQGSVQGIDLYLYNTYN